MIIEDIKKRMRADGHIRLSPSETKLVLETLDSIVDLTSELDSARGKVAGYLRKEIADQIEIKNLSQALSKAKRDLFDEYYRTGLYRGESFEQAAVFAKNAIEERNKHVNP